MSSKIQEFALNAVGNFPEQYDESFIGELVNRIRSEFGVPCEYFYAGSYDSPGYDCSYFNIVWLEDDQLKSTYAQVESY